jgi:simple sugar transport system ATP-binding protein
VLISEDLDELLVLSDRIGAMVSGRLSSPEPVETLTLERLGLLMSGSGAERAA